MRPRPAISAPMCRELGVPFLDVRMDIFDKCYTAPDELKGQMSEFFQAMDPG